MSLKIFVSHSSKYKELALKLKLGLQALEASKHLDIRVSEEMQGATDWRQWIEEQVRSADVFVLLYPHAGMDMGWSNYELGRFYDLQRPIVCIKNTDILNPPPAFQPYQAYDANAAGLYKFLKELFADGAFSQGVPINADVGTAATEFNARAREVCNVLAAQFDDERIREHLYERRLEFSLSYNRQGDLDPEKSFVEGNVEGLHLLGLTAGTATPWVVLDHTLGEQCQWLQELRAALPAMRTGALPPALSPVRCPSGIYLPIVIKAGTAEGQPRKVVVIFVSAGIDKLLPMLGWSFPKAMPEGFTYVVQLVRMMFRARWDILEPRYQELRFKSPSPERCSQIAAAVLADYDQMQQSFESEGKSGLGRFFGAFHKDLRDEVAAGGDEWMELTGRLRANPPTTQAELAPLLQALMKNNARWLSLAARQFNHSVDDLV